MRAAGEPRISDYIAGWLSSPFTQFDGFPWLVTQQADELVRAAIAMLGPDYAVDGTVAIHATAIVEAPATLKGAVILGRIALSPPGPIFAAAATSPRIASLARAPS